MTDFQTTVATLSELTGDYVLDPTRTRIGFVAKHAMATRVRGRFEAFEGSPLLDVDGHPALIFTSTRVQHLGGTGFRVTGALTIRGVTKLVTVDFELTGAEDDPRGDVRLAFTGSVTINRNDWGVNWNAATTLMVSPKVTLELDVAAIRQP
ncbi:YceI family protein [Nonomuraea sp. RK-328]|nr:YceI family protein [Nonomuraea sp. RK-328]